MAVKSDNTETNNNNNNAVATVPTSTTFKVLSTIGVPIRKDEKGLPIVLTKYTWEAGELITTEDLKDIDIERLLNLKTLEIVETR